MVALLRWARTRSSSRHVAITMTCTHASFAVIASASTACKTGWSLLQLRQHSAYASDTGALDACGLRRPKVSGLLLDRYPGRERRVGVWQMTACSTRASSSGWVESRRRAMSSASAHRSVCTYALASRLLRSLTGSSDTESNDVLPWRGVPPRPQRPRRPRRILCAEDRPHPGIPDQGRRVGCLLKCAYQELDRFQRLPNGQERR